MCNIQQPSTMEGARDCLLYKQRSIAVSPGVPMVAVEALETTLSGQASRQWILYPVMFPSSVSRKRKREGNRWKKSAAVAALAPPDSFLSDIIKSD